MSDLKECLKNKMYGVITCPQNDFIYGVPTLRDPDCPKGRVYFVGESFFNDFNKMLNNKNNEN